MQCKGVFVYSNGALPKVYPKDINNSLQAADTLQKLCKDICIPENLKSDRALYLCGQETSYLKLSQGNQINLTYAYPEWSNEIYNIDMAIRNLKKR